MQLKCGARREPVHFLIRHLNQHFSLLEREQPEMDEFLDPDFDSIGDFENERTKNIMQNYEFMKACGK